MATSTDQAIVRETPRHLRRTVRVLLGALAAAAVAIAVVTTLHARADENRDSQVKLAQLETELNALQGLPWEAIPGEGPPPAVVRQEMEASKRRIETVLASLLGKSFVPRALGRTKAPFRANVGALDEIRGFAARKRLDLTSEPKAKADRELSVTIRTLQAASSEYAARAATALTQAMVGSAVAILLLLAAFGAFYYRSARARSTAERLASALRTSEEHLAEAQHVAAVGSWEWRATNDELKLSAEQKRLHGWTHGDDVPSAGALLRVIHPDDRTEVAAALEVAWRDEVPQEVEYRVNIAGETRVIYGQGAVVRDADGLRVGLMGTCQDVTERFRRVEAERANRTKTEFLSRMSHELRTPLNAILGFGQLLGRSEIAERQNDNVQQILKSGYHLLDLVDEVLEISRIEAGELRLSLEPVELATLLGDAADLIGPEAAARGIALNAGAGESDAWVRADHQRLKQVLLNLLSNAVKYNRDSGRVEVRVEPTAAGRVKIVVADTGFGIAAEQLPCLFRPFERLAADNGEIEGTGLGLALSKNLVEAMGGAITVESTLGAGSEFTVELEAAEPIQSTTPAIDDPGPAILADGAHPKVLCIEDNVSNLRLLERIFAARPRVELLTAVQGRLGAELARRHRPDLILLDLNLPDVEGDRVLEQLQADPATEEVPVVIVSADATPHRLERLLSMGAHSYLTKPIDVDELLRVVDHTLSAPEPSRCP